ncbi:MAG: kelch repeat-containing protein, partial [Blastocatellia bacterium]
MSFAFVKQLMRPGCWRYQRLLSPYFDDELERGAVARLERHLDVCVACRTHYENMGFAARLVADLPLPEAEPAPPWTPPDSAAQPLGQPRRLVFKFAPVAALLVIAVAALWYFLRAPKDSWEVTRLSGQPEIEANPIARTARLHTGEWLETDATSRALIHVGQLGQVEVDPRSRVQLVKTGANEYRLALARGRLYASIVAAPRLFQVETPSAVAIDLGCAYTLNVDEAGGSLLRVTSGWVALARDGREAFVPAGASARAEPDGRLGTPYFEDASAKLRQALARFDFASDKMNALGDVLAEARARDALTLWHLLARVEGAEREQTYERLITLVPAAKAFSKASSKEGTLRLDPATMAQWKEAVEFASVGVDPRKVPIAAGTLKPVGPMLAMRQSHTATLLPDGKVLIAGGSDRNAVSASTELFDPVTGGFSHTGSMTTPRAAHEATLLPDGKVLITGGMAADYKFLASAELYDPATQRFTGAGGMRIARGAHRATLLANGKVLITGGLSFDWPQQKLAEIYDPATGAFSSAGEMTVSRADHTATLLPNGQALI